MSAHFSPAAFKFLRSLARHNNREWFNERKSTYEQELKTPMLNVIHEINKAMVAFAPDHLRPAHKVFMRIYRDIRFSQDKRPYKTHVAAWWARQGLEKTSGGGYYFEISPCKSPSLLGFTCRSVSSSSPSGVICCSIMSNCAFFSPPGRSSRCSLLSTGCG